MSNRGRIFCFKTLRTSKVNFEDIQKSEMILVEELDPLTNVMFKTYYTLKGEIMIILKEEVIRNFKPKIVHKLTFTPNHS